jgi:hypothetical protein
LKAQLSPLLLTPGHTIFIRLKNEPLESVVTGYDQVVLEDFGDPFSADMVARWRRILGRDPSFILKSPWSRHGYPFSTVDVYHGPARIYIFQRSAKLAPSVPQTAPVGGE